ncbi:DUF2946 family protein [Pinisolibacter sp.]|uniref:DUF2946 family protein n=1 Tax=Pinisolibacter sp. TaxID=2172024 RepID=UPI002FDCF044
MTSLRKRTIWLGVWLAMIVQIVAPVLAGANMVAAATDPLAGAWICGHAGPGDPDQPAGTDEACRLCDVVCKGGMAPPVEAAELPVAVEVVLAVVWTDESRDLVGRRAPDRARARAPPALV